MTLLFPGKLISIYRAAPPRSLSTLSRCRRWTDGGELHCCTVQWQLLAGWRTALWPCAPLALGPAALTGCAWLDLTGRSMHEVVARDFPVHFFLFASTSDSYPPVKVLTVPPPPRRTPTPRQLDLSPPYCCFFPASRPLARVPRRPVPPSCPPSDPVLARFHRLYNPCPGVSRHFTRPTDRPPPSRRIPYYSPASPDRLSRSDPAASLAVAHHSRLNPLRAHRFPSRKRVREV